MSDSDNQYLDSPEDSDQDAYVSAAESFDSDDSTCSVGRRKAAAFHAVFGSSSSDDDLQGASAPEAAAAADVSAAGDDIQQGLQTGRDNPRDPRLQASRRAAAQRQGGGQPEQPEQPEQPAQQGVAKGR